MHYLIYPPLPNYGIIIYFLDEKWRLREAKSFAKTVKHGRESGSNFISTDFRAQSLTQ